MAQKITDFQLGYQLNIQPTTDPIKIDGVLDEAVWTKSEVATHFKKKYPNDIGEPKRKTEVRYTYDDKNIYFAFVVYDSGTAIIKSLKRDFGHDGNDDIAIILDPQNQKTTGFFFVVSHANVQSEDQLSANNDGQLTFSWDTKWFSATKDYGNYWVAEIMIPLKSLRYDAKNTNWGINFLRVDAKNNEYSAWTKIPPVFHSYDLGYTGILHWPAPPPQSKKNIIFLPYITGNSNTDAENHKTLSSSGGGGFDAKVALNSSLNVDLTVNPDFSQVDADQQVTNLTRFDIFLPEKRSFFLENADLFSSFGIPPIRPFYSRTIGLDKDGNKIPILFGARISGNLSSDTRIGMMDIQTGRQGTYNPENFSAFTIHKKILKRSQIKAYFLNKETDISAADLKKNPLDKYGRNAGVAFEYSNPEGSFGYWTTYHQSFKANIHDMDSYAEAGIMSSSKHWNVVGEIGNVGKNFYTDMGYVQRIQNYDAIRDTNIRVGFKNLYSSISYFDLPATGKLSKWQLRSENFTVFNPDNTLNEMDLSNGIQLDLKNTSFTGLNLNTTVLNLLYPTSPTGATPLPAKNYTYNQLSFMYKSDFRKIFGWNTSITTGQYYNGTMYGAAFGMNWRSQPHLAISIKAEVDHIELPKPYGSGNIILIAPKVDWNFSTQLFWSNFIQYDTQLNNFNVNSRLQYRFKPMSDFFLVYTDNYYTDPLLKNRNRALIFKFSYWFNL